MKKTFILLFLSISCSLYASPYANPWLYEKMIDFIKNPSMYQDNFTNGIVQSGSPDIIVGAFIEDAYSVYEQEEEYADALKSCGDNCFQDNISIDILGAYHKFFYTFAVALPVSEILLQNPAANENISYYIQNKHVIYTWENQDHLIINIDDNILEFKKQKDAIMINFSWQVLNSYILN